VQVCALISVAESTGANRIVQGISVLHPVGDPALGPEGDRAARRALLERALTAVSGPARGVDAGEAR
jgi:betaine reductase